MQVVILVAGLGTRLRGSIPESLAKPMAPVNGRPFLEYVLDRALAQGADEFVMLSGHASASVQGHFGDSYGGIPVRYSAEPAPLGTGGAVRNAGDLLRPEFVLLNGDTYAEVDFGELIARLDDAPLTLTLVEVDDTGRFGRVAVAGGTVVGLDEKGVPGPGLINAGVYGCARELLELMPDTARVSLENDVLVPRLPELSPSFVIASPVFFDIGVPADYEAAKQYFLQRESRPGSAR
ncbi:MAG: NTP transferase domain-containing protein [Salinibacterium sp.]|nr:NTP transferase domain-containing protein [Salinibacterium sp.]